LNGVAALRLVGAVAIGRQAGLGLAALLTIAVAARLPVLADGQIDYDEGVYWQSLRALAAGHPLFTSVYSSQPPAFLMLLFPAHLLLGGSIQADRTAMVAFSVVGMVAAYQLGTLLESRWTGLAAASVLAVDPLSFRESVTLQADGPAIALALAGLALAAAGRRRDDQAGALLAAAAGLTFATGFLVKPLAAPALPALAILLASPSNGQRRLLQIGAAAVGAGVAACAFLLPYADRLPVLQDELVGFHARARGLELGGLDGPTALTEMPLVALALAGVAAGLRRQPLLLLVGGTWAVSGALLLALHRPLWPHHALVLVAPLAMLGAGAGHLARGAPARLRASLILLLVALLASTLWIHAQQTSDGSRSRAVSAVKRVTEPNQFVITDDQYTVGLANRSTPPELVDTSKVRVLSGDLTLNQLDTIANRPDVCAVLVDDHYVSLSLLPGFRDWLDRRFPVARPLGEGRVLYLRTPPRRRSGPVSPARTSSQAPGIPPSGQGCGLRAAGGHRVPAPR
jgi:uncharacterized protein (TIGR03382 family)